MKQCPYIINKLFCDNPLIGSENFGCLWYEEGACNPLEIIDNSPTILVRTSASKVKT